jgi:hypothetical protein
MMDATCETCRFAVKESRVNETIGGEVFLSRHYPMCENLASPMFGVYLQKDSGCGEHQPRDTEGETP